MPKMAYCNRVWRSDFGIRGRCLYSRTGRGHPRRISIVQIRMRNTGSPVGGEEEGEITNENAQFIRSRDYDSAKLDYGQVSRTKTVGAPERT